jgi:hypothetical protein
MDPSPTSLYDQQFEKAVQYYDEGNQEMCVKEANKNLIYVTPTSTCFCSLKLLTTYTNSDPALPQSYFIRNCVLLACAIDNWHEAFVHRNFAE